MKKLFFVAAGIVVGTFAANLLAEKLRKAREVAELEQLVQLTRDSGA